MERRRGSPSSNAEGGSAIGGAPAMALAPPMALPCGGRASKTGEVQMEGVRLAAGEKVP